MSEPFPIGSAMRQFTMNISDGLLLAAKEHALRSGLSLSDLVRGLLAREVGWSESEAPPPLDKARALSVLRRYSTGEITRRQAMYDLELGPERHADFVEAMNQLSIPWPRPDSEDIDREAESVVRAIQEAEDEN